MMGSLLLAGAAVVAPYPAAMRAIHLGLMLFGWLVQFVLGVAYWMLPRYAAKPERGSLPAAWSAFALFQCGLGLSVVGQVFPLHGAIAVAGTRLLVAATFAFLWLLWGRVKPFAAR
jgi:hypothetical protein